jgi:Rieske Fe-S protein
MATTRRVFLEIVGAGAAASSLDFGCIAIVEDARALDQQGKDVGPNGTGGSGTGGAQPALGGGGTSTGGQGTGGEIAGSGGATPGTGGRTGSGGAQADAGVGGIPTDARPVDGNDGAARDATAPPMLMAGDILAGNASGLVVGALNALQGRAVAIGRDASGIYALTLVCTHQGCTAAPSGNTGARLINCPCHGSQFDGVGNVRRGPAGRPLVHYGVTIDASGAIIVHSNMQVAANVRAMP